MPLSRLKLLLPGDANHNVLLPHRFDGLKDDILKYGFDEPVQVWSQKGDIDRGDLWVVNGHKRYAAMQAIGAHEILVVPKRFKNRKEALAYSIRRNQERGNNDDKILAGIVKELADSFDDIDAMSASLCLTERELYDLQTVNEDIELPERKNIRSRDEKETLAVRVIMVMSPEAKALLDTAIRRASRSLGLTSGPAPLVQSRALEAILRAYLGVEGG